MALATWWRGDALPHLPNLDTFTAGLTGDNCTLARLTGLTVEEIQTRRQAGHQPYLAYLGGVPVAYGWVATRRAGIGELGLEFNIPPLHRYLWDFITLPAWRGQGIYPHLLQAILRQEASHANFFWIIHAPENRPSGTGIFKAGFNPVGKLSIRRGGRPGLTPQGNGERALTGAALLGVPLCEQALSPCWHCGGAAYPAKPEAAACACHSSAPPADCLCVSG